MEFVLQLSIQPGGDHQHRTLPFKSPRNMWHNCSSLNDLKGPRSNSTVFSFSSLDADAGLFELGQKAGSEESCINIEFL